MSLITKRADAYFMAAKLLARGQSTLSVIQMVRATILSSISDTKGESERISLTEDPAWYNTCLIKLETALRIMDNASDIVSDPVKLAEYIESAWKTHKEAAEFIHKVNPGLANRINTSNGTFVMALDKLKTPPSDPAPKEVLHSPNPNIAPSGVSNVSTDPSGIANKMRTERSSEPASQDVISNQMLAATKQLLDMSGKYLSFSRGGELEPGQQRSLKDYLNKVKYYKQTVVPKNISYLSQSDPRRKEFEDLGKKLHELEIQLGLGF